MDDENRAQEPIAVLEGRTLYLDVDRVRMPSWHLNQERKEKEIAYRRKQRLDPWGFYCGRPMKYRTPEAMEEALEKYFTERVWIAKDKFGAPIIDPKTGEFLKLPRPYTMSGLAMVLGVETATLRRWRENARQFKIDPRFDEIITYALQRVEQYAEERGYELSGSKGSAFVLERAFTWKSAREDADIVNKKVQNKVAEAKLTMEKEMHDLKMRLMQQTMDAAGAEDKEIKITIVPAVKGGEEIA